YLPPRAHVLTVGDQEFNARMLAERASYLARVGNEQAQRTPAEEAATSLIRQEVLLQVGAGQVDDVTDEDVRVAVAENLELGEEYADEEFATALQNYLQATSLSRDEHEQLTRAGVIERRLEAQFQETLPEVGEQMNLQRVLTPSRGLAQSLIEAVRGGQDFAEAAVDLGVVSNPEEEVQQLGWFAPSILPDRIAPAVASLQTGDISEPIEDSNRIGFEVYVVVERTSDEPYEEIVRTQLSRRALDEWMEEQETTMGIERNLTSSDMDWIRRQVQAALRG
ncbi:MAG: peptidylprolyl isomerase, partial [Dehalococcoidia bacterium]